MTPEERAAALTDLWDHEGSVLVMRAAIAAAIREAVDAETRRCAAIVDTSIPCRCVSCTISDLATHDADCSWVVADHLRQRATARRAAEARHR